MSHARPHLFVDISSHGFGHLAQAAPVLNRLAELVPALRLTLRSGLPIERLRQRLRPAFDHIADSSDFGYIMHDAVTLDLPATAAAYRAFHTDFPTRISHEAHLLKQLGVDHVFSDVAYLPLAGAAMAGISATAMCSLNWADLFAHYFGHEPWAAPIHAEMLAAYRSAPFLRVTPGMPMPSLSDTLDIGPIGVVGKARRMELRTIVGAEPTATIIVIALGGIPIRLPFEHWPARPDLRYLVPAVWQPQRADFHTIESLAWPFADVLRSVDAVVTKPGYGTFAEAAGNGTAVIYQRRANWPEQPYLIDWLTQNTRCAEVDASQLASGDFADALEEIKRQAVAPAPTFGGIGQAARFLAEQLRPA